MKITNLFEQRAHGAARSGKSGHDARVSSQVAAKGRRKDDVQLSSVAEKITETVSATEPMANPVRISKLREAVRDGTLNVDTHQLAVRILEEASA